MIWDNTIYCNLRLEYLDDVLALLERITSTGTWYVLNCGNANDFELVRGHPRLKEDVMRRELGSVTIARRAASLANPAPPPIPALLPVAQRGACAARRRRCAGPHRAPPPPCTTGGCSSLCTCTRACMT